MPRPTSSTRNCARSSASELTISTVEAKHKLSQNRNADDQAGRWKGLRG